jgi:predicted transposase/invertase (TIGR01784 family)
MSDDELLLPDHLPELLPPSEDGIFKTLLTHPDAEPVLRDIISSVLGIPIVSVEVRNVELPISDIDEKRERLDVNCKADSDKQVAVEMQMKAMLGDSIDNNHINVKSRAIYELCDLHAAQPGRGVSYRDLSRSYQIMFCCYNVFPDSKEFVHRFSFRNENGEELLDTVGIIFIELSRLEEVLKKPVEEMTALEIWSVFFSVADKPKYRDLLKSMINAKEEIKVANDILASISSDPVERAHYRSRMIFQMDMDHNLIEAKAEGKAEGIQTRNREIAIRLLKRNRPIEEIMEDTDLPRVEIEKIRDKRSGASLRSVF